MGLTKEKCTWWLCPPESDLPMTILIGIHLLVGMMAIKTPIDNDTPIKIIKNVKFNPPDESPEYKLKNPLTPNNNNNNKMKTLTSHILHKNVHHVLVIMLPE
jgi:hypothetical protein